MPRSILQRHRRRAYSGEEALLLHEADGTTDDPADSHTMMVYYQWRQEGILYLQAVYESFNFYLSLSFNRWGWASASSNLRLARADASLWRNLLVAEIGRCSAFVWWPCKVFRFCFHLDNLKLQFASNFHNSMSIQQFSQPAAILWKNYSLLLFQSFYWLAVQANSWVR